MAVSAATLSGTPVPGVAAAAYAVLDVDTGRFLVEHRADEVREPASLTKIMTALVAVEEAPLGKVGRVSAAAAGTPGNRVGLVTGEKLEMWELLYGALFCSGNDAARALAETVAGTQEAFVARMNAKARALGLRHTTFANPHGLSAPGHRSTARELALIGRAALQNEVVARIVGRTERVLPWGGRGRHLHNINRFLHLYPGATGMKTGYTSAAGYCLMASAQRGGHRLVAVVLGSTSSWQRYQDGMRILDAAFARQAWQEPAGTRSRIYVVQPGDTFWGVARRFRVEMEALVKANPGVDPDRIRVGDRLCLP
ncbi:MAG: LysM peptidoglycan-binding domain-containing protein [Betaproteobacteria bacterium]